MNRVLGGFSLISRPVLIIPALRWSLIMHRDIFVPTRRFCALRVSAVRFRYCAKTIYGFVIETRRRVVCRKGKVDAGLIEIEQLRILPVAGCVVVISADQPDFCASIVFYFPCQFRLEDGVCTGLLDCFPMTALISGGAGLKIIMCVSLHDEPDDNRATKSSLPEDRYHYFFIFFQHLGYLPNCHCVVVVS